MELEEVPMQIVSALDVHRRQITCKTVDLESGEMWRGRISPGARDLADPAGDGGQAGASGGRRPTTPTAICS